MEAFLDALSERLHLDIEPESLLARIQKDLSAVYACEKQIGDGDIYPELQALLQDRFTEEPDKSLPGYRILIAWAMVRHLGWVIPEEETDPLRLEHKIAATSGAWIREWFLRKHIAQAFQDLGAEADVAATANDWGPSGT